MSIIYAVVVYINNMLYKFGDWSVTAAGKRTLLIKYRNWQFAVCIFEQKH